jgi:hypothetical protein
MILLVVIAFIMLAIFTTLLVVSLDNSKVHMSQIARVLLVVMLIGCLMACVVFFNWCQFFHDGFC